MDYKIKVDYTEVEVCIDSYTEGELDYVNTWDINLDGKTFDTLRELLSAINLYSGGIFTINVDDYIYIDGRIDTDALVNVDNDTPTDQEIAEWKDGKTTLYNAHLFCGITMVPVGYDHAMTAAEAEELGLAVY